MACDVQSLIDDAACLSVELRQAIIAQLLCRLNVALDPMATCDVQDLINDARDSGFTGKSPEFLAAIQTQLLCNIAGSPAFGGGTVYGGNGDPNGVQVGSPPDVYVQYDAGGRLWSKTSGVATSAGWE